MRSAQSLSNQIELLISFNNLLSNVMSDLVMCNSAYERSIEELHNSGLWREYVQTLESENFVAFQKKMVNVIEHLESQDIRYVKELIGEISSKRDNIN